MSTRLAARSPVSLPSAAGLPSGRRHAGLVLVALGLPLLTAVLVQLRGTLALAPTLLIYLLAVVVAAAVGGVLPAVLAAALSFGLANWFLTPPYGTLAVSSRDAVVELLVFLAVSVAVSVAVEMGARQRALAARSRFEADLLEELTEEPVAEASPEQILEQLRQVFGMATLTLAPSAAAGEVVAQVGPSADGPPVVDTPAGSVFRLRAWGPELFGEDRRLLENLAQAAGRAVEARELADEASRARELENADRVRSAVLAAVGHELRTPLAGTKAAVSSLLQDDVTFTAEEQTELLDTIDQCTDRLTDLVSNLLDLSRVQAGAVPVHLGAVAVDDLLPRALPVGDGQHSQLTQHIPDDLPMVLADAGLLETVLANLLANALRASPPDQPAEIHARAGDRDIEIRVVDHGPGVPPERWDRMFVAFQRLDDRSSNGGLGLGLAIARGFTEAMGGTIEPGTTPGGGLSMTLHLPAAS
ncbi:MAG TPA: ATP-binding protein [Actinomycetales bacterium]|nr:ATP-binding protein [Actinomycetales bacterium]